MRGELWKVSVEQCRHATSQEQMAKELLAGELEALKEELGRTAQKRTFKDMTREEFPPIEGEDNSGGRDREGGVEWVPDDRPAQRRRVLSPEEIPVPQGDDDDLSEFYEPSEHLPHADEAAGVSSRRTSEASSNLRPTVGEPEPWPSPGVEPVAEMHPMAANADPGDSSGCYEKRGAGWQPAWKCSIRGGAKTSSTTYRGGDQALLECQR